MRWFSTLVVVLCLLGSGCATVTTGDAGTPLSPSGEATPERATALVVRSRLITSVSNPHLPAFELSFENHSRALGRRSRGFASTRRTLGDSGPVLIAPNETWPDWRAAVLHEKRVRDHNRDTWLAATPNACSWVGRRRTVRAAAPCASFANQSFRQRIPCATRAARHWVRRNRGGRFRQPRLVRIASAAQFRHTRMRRVTRLPAHLVSKDVGHTKCTPCAPARRRPSS